MTTQLYGYKYSVYAWIARFALHEKGVPYDWVEIDPFSDDLPTAYLAMHPFGRVPTFVHGDFVLYETGAITRYVDEAFSGPELQPKTPHERARMAQIMSIIDSDAYWPLVRQVFSHDIFQRLMQQPCDPTEVENGLAEAPRILGALNDLASGNRFLIGQALTLADLHLAPMMAYFHMSGRGRQLCEQYSRLRAWWQVVSQRQALAETTPALPQGQT